MPTAVATNLPGYIDALTLLGDESRLRLCALLRERELCVTDLVRVTGIAQSRVSTHLGRLREAGFVRDRRKGPQSFYALARTRCRRRCAPASTRRRLGRSDARRRPAAPARARRRAARRPAGVAPATSSSATTRPGAPGSRSPSASRPCCGSATCSTSGSGDGAAAAALAPYCRSLTCIDTNARMIEAARERLATSRPRARPGRRRARAAVRATRPSTPCSCSTR